MPREVSAAEEALCDALEAIDEARWALDTARTTVSTAIVRARTESEQTHVSTSGNLRYTLRPRAGGYTVINEGGEEFSFATRAEADSWLAEQDSLEARGWPQGRDAGRRERP